MGTLVVVREGQAGVVHLERDTIALLFGGEPVGTRILQGNVIASSVERLEQALREQGALS